MRTATTQHDAASSQEDGAWTQTDLAGDPHCDEHKAQKVRAMFAAIAGRYDLNNRLHSLWRDQAWRRAAVRDAGLEPGETVLDVACGTGDLACAFARAGASSVVGVDFTPEMLEIARARAGRTRFADRLSFVEADAQELPIDDDSVDVVSIAFGIRNIADPARALREMSRVLKPGGRLVILEFGQPRSMLLAPLHRFYSEVVMPRTATWISGDRTGAYRYLPRSIKTFLDADRLTSLVREVGFKAVTVRELTFGVCVCCRGVKAPIDAASGESAHTPAR